MLLNVLMQLGNTRRMQLVLTAGSEHYDVIREGLQQFGASVAARKETIVTATESLHRVMELLDTGLASSSVTVDLAFDEYNLDLDVSYDGQAIVLVKTRPDHETVLNDPTGLAQLSSWLLSRRADRIRVKTAGERCHVLLRLAN